MDSQKVRGFKVTWQNADLCGSVGDRTSAQEGLGKNKGVTVTWLELGWEKSNEYQEGKIDWDFCEGLWMPVLGFYI